MVNINGETWDVLLVPPSHSGLQRSDGSWTIGMCDDKTKHIYISEEIEDKQLMKKVLCHELTHAAMFSYNVDLSYEQEEIVADIISTYGQEIVHMTNLIFNRIKKK